MAVSTYFTSKFVSLCITQQNKSMCVLCYLPFLFTQVGTGVLQYSILPLVTVLSQFVYMVLKIFTISFNLFSLQFHSTSPTLPKSNLCSTSVFSLMHYTNFTLSYTHTSITHPMQMQACFISNLPTSSTFNACISQSCNVTLHLLTPNAI